MTQRMLLISLFFLAACAAPVTERTRLQLDRAQLKSVQDTVSYGLKDPGAAQFRNIRWFENKHEDGSTSNLVCGEVNGKNSFGAYVGFRPFSGRMNGGIFVLYGIASADNAWLYNANCPV